MSVPLKIAIALTLGFLCCLKQIQTYSSEINRFYLNWNQLDTIAIFLGPVLLAAVFLTSHFTLRKRPVYKGIEMALILFIVAQAVITYFWPRKMGLTGKLILMVGIWIPIGAAMLQAFRNPRAPGFKLIQEGILIFSPIVVMITFTIFNWSVWPSPIEELTHQESAGSDQHPIYIFYYDAWSARRTMGEDGKFLPKYPNIRDLASRSHVFSEAYSTDHSTFPSIPNCLYLVDDDFRCAHEHYLVENPKTPDENLFGIARKAGYSAYLVGFKIPYRSVLGDSGGTVRSYAFDPHPEGLLPKILHHLQGDFLFSKNPISLAAKNYFYRRLVSNRWVFLNQATLEDTHNIIESGPNSSLGIFHLPVPHSPFIFDAQGNYKGPYKGPISMGTDLPGYLEHLGYLDTVIGKMVAKLKDAEKYDDALIIMTADHSWIEDTYEGNKIDILRRKRHVPLIIKSPGQTEGVEVSGRREVLDLIVLIKEALESGQGNRVQLQEFISPE